MLGEAGRKKNGKSKGEQEKDSADLC